jgi:protein TonB
VTRAARSAASAGALATSEPSVTVVPQPRATSLLDAPRVATSRVSVIAGAGTVGVHAGLFALCALIGTSVATGTGRSVLLSQMVEVELPRQAPPDPAPEPERAAPEPTRPRVASARRAAPPPAAAQAGRVLAAPDEVVDFGDAFVAGKAASHVGGVTEAGGSATQAARDPNAHAGGVPGGAGTDLAGDLARPPQLAGGAVWDCPFPIEADDAGVDHAVVGLRVEVNAEGRVLSANTRSDPGHGFAREARRCALSKRWTPGFDRAGRPVGAVAAVNVRFDR